MSKPKAVLLAVSGDVIGVGNNQTEAIKDFEREFEAVDFEKEKIDVYVFSHQLRIKQNAVTYERVK